MKKSIRHKIGSVSFLLLGLFYFASLLFQVNPTGIFGQHNVESSSTKGVQCSINQGHSQLQNAIEVEQVQIELCEVEEEESETTDRDFVVPAFSKHASATLLASHQFDCTDKIRVQRNCHANQSAGMVWYLLYEDFRL